MTVRCPECKLVYAYINEPVHTSLKIIFRDVVCKCGHTYRIAYKQGSMHQFNPDAIPEGMADNVSLLR